MKIRPEQRDAALLAAGRIERRIDLAAGAKLKLSDDERTEMLRACVAGEHVKLMLEGVIAYEHKTDEQNRRFVRLRDGAVLSAAKTAIGRPFLRDHDQGNSLARAGTIIASRGVRRGDGDYAIVMDVELTAPWAVELALRGLLTFVSVGLRATGMVLCSHCETEVLSECFHFPGDEIGAEVGADQVVCEWVFTSAEIVECSAVNVPAVPGAHIEGIRAALSALDPEPPKEDLMNLAARLAAIFSLAATAGETEVLSAVEAQGKRVKTLEAELGIANKDLGVVTAERDALREAKLAADAKAFIDEAVSLGKIAPADSETWSELYALDSTKAVALMAKRAANVATPAGKKPQTPAGDPAPVPAKGETSKTVEAALSSAGLDAENTRYFARVFGATNPNKSIAAAIGASVED